MLKRFLSVLKNGSWLNIRNNVGGLHIAGAATIRGKPVAALGAVSNADKETVSLSNGPQFLALIERSRSRQEAEGGITSQEMRRRLRLKKTKRLK